MKNLVSDILTVLDRPATDEAKVHPYEDLAFKRQQLEDIRKLVAPEIGRIDRRPVISSNVVSVGYDPESETLEVEFRFGVYRYRDVPKDLAQPLLDPSPEFSVGAYVAQLGHQFTGKKQ